jgi:hypothetical protein
MLAQGTGGWSGIRATLRMSTLHSPLWLGLEKLLLEEQGHGLYLLVNQSAFASSMKSVERLASFEKQPLLGQVADAWRDSATPFVAALRGATSDEGKMRALRRLCDDGCYGSALHVIASNLTLHALADELTVRCEALLPDDYEVLLRYFDTRILASLMEVMTPEQSVMFFSCSQRWHYADRRGVLIQAHLFDDDTEIAVSAPLVLSVVQQNALIQAGEVDAVIDVLMRNKIEPLLDMPFPERHPTISRLINAAAGWALNSTADLAAYCTLALLGGEGFDKGEPWSSQLALVKRGDIRFSDALALVEAQPA